jgi:hypothetical protein
MRTGGNEKIFRRQPQPQSVVGREPNRVGPYEPRLLCSVKRTIVFSNRDPFNLIEAHFVAPAIVQLGCARRGVIRHNSWARLERRQREPW